MTARPRNDLILKFYVAGPLCSPGAMAALQALFDAHLPVWRSGLRVMPEDQEEPGGGVAVEEKSLSEVVSSVSPMRFGLSAVNILGAYEGVKVFVQCSRNGLPPESNVLTCEVEDTATVEGRAVADWANEFFRAITGAIPVRYAHARTRGEFDDKNMVRVGRTVRAIGVNLMRSLPGMYWLNFFGPEYVEMLGSDELGSVPAPVVERVDGGVLVGLDEDPTRWNTEECRLREKAAITHLGKQYFFSKADPESPTKGPVFRRP